MRRLPVLFLFAWAPAAAAADQATPWTMLTLNETAAHSVPADRLVTRLRLEQSGADARAVQADVNRQMAAALERAHAEPDVKTEGGAYYVTSSSPPPEQRAEPVWTAVQELTLTGADAGKVLALAGALQDQGFVFSDMRQELSEDRQRAEREALLRQATTRLRATADAAAAGLGLHFAGWNRVSLAGDGQPPPSPRFARMAMAAEAMPAPESATAEIEVRVTVEGEARLVQLP